MKKIGNIKYNPEFSIEEVDALYGFLEANDSLPGDGNYTCTKKQFLGLCAFEENYFDINSRDGIISISCFASMLEKIKGIGDDNVLEILDKDVSDSENDGIRVCTWDDEEFYFYTEAQGDVENAMMLMGYDSHGYYLSFFNNIEEPATPEDFNWPHKGVANEK